MVTYSSDFPESFNKCVLRIFKLNSKNPDLVGVLHTCNLALWKLRQENCEFKVSCVVSVSERKKGQERERERDKEGVGEGIKRRHDR